MSRRLAASLAVTGTVAAITGVVLLGASACTVSTNLPEALTTAAASSAAPGSTTPDPATADTVDISRFSADGEIPNTYVPPVADIRAAAGTKIDPSPITTATVYQGVAFSDTMFTSTGKGNSPVSVGVGVVSADSVDAAFATYEDVGWQYLVERGSDTPPVLTIAMIDGSTMVMAFVAAHGYLSTGTCTFSENQPDIDTQIACATNLAETVAAHPIP